MVKYTKSQKSRRSSIRSEFEWVAKIPQDRPHLIENFGVAKWLDQMLQLNKEYKEASDNRDELFDSTLFVLASLDTNLYQKMLDTPKDLTISELEFLLPFLKQAGVN